MLKKQREKGSLHLKAGDYFFDNQEALSKGFFDLWPLCDLRYSSQSWGRDMNQKLINKLSTGLMALTLAACAPDSKDKIVVPTCSESVVQAFDNIDRRTSLYSRKKSKAHLTSILQSCADIQTSLNGSNCAVVEPQFKEALLVSYENIRFTCEAARSY